MYSELSQEGTAAAELPDYNPRRSWEKYNYNQINYISIPLCDLL